MPGTAPVGNFATRREASRLGRPTPERYAMIIPAGRLLAAVLCVAVMAAGCASNPATGGADVVTMSEKKEIEIGRQMHPKILQQYGRYNDERLQAYVNEVGQRLAAKGDRPELTYTFTVLDSAGDQCLRAAGRLRLHHARDHELSQQRGGALRGTRSRDRSRHGAARGPAAGRCHRGGRRRNPDCGAHRQRQPRQYRQCRQFRADRRVRPGHGARGRCARRQIRRQGGLRPTSP